jgi:glutamate--cysteine ligase
MSIPAKAEPVPITDKRQLVEYLARGAKPKSRWRIGTEHEKFGFRTADLSPLPYEGPQGIRAMLEGLTRFGWSAVYEGEAIIGLSLNNASVSLEPGGQLELSGAPLRNLHETCQEVYTHLDQVKQVAGELGVGFHGLGFQPKHRREEMFWMPKGRYSIMRRYMPTKGGHGLDMMTRTCTAQVNLDFASEADMVKKLRVGLALQPIATALFANSPFAEGKPTGYLSYRSFIWTDTDPDRTGMLDFVFEDGMGFERYTDYALDVPMYFVYRDGRYIDAAGQSFRDFLKGRLPALPGEVPVLGDWADHLTTLFPEVRLKPYLEMRGADGGPWNRLCALPAFWVGLLYDGAALDAASSLSRDGTREERETLRAEVPRRALKTAFRKGTVQALAREALAIARQGLARGAVLDSVGRDETRFLEPLEAIADSGKTAAEDLLELYETRWGKSVDPLFTEFIY